jgi:hypothetical protein
MHKNAAREVLSELDREHHATLSLCSDRARLDGELARALDLMPDAETWMIARTKPQVWVQYEGVLFVVSAVVPESCVVVSSGPLGASDALAVELSWNPPVDGTGATILGTRWTFLRSGEAANELDDWQAIQGEIAISQDGKEVLDRHELFARAIAERAGWTGAVPSGDRAPKFILA